MNIDLLSDLHLECYKDPVLALKHMVLWEEDPECLVIAGDFFTCVKETAFRSLVKFLTNEIGFFAVIPKYDQT